MFLNLKDPPKFHFFEKSPNTFNFLNLSTNLPVKSEIVLESALYPNNKQYLEYNPNIYKIPYIDNVQSFDVNCLQHSQILNLNTNKHYLILLSQLFDTADVIKYFDYDYDILLINLYKCLTIANIYNILGVPLTLPSLLQLYDIKYFCKTLKITNNCLLFNDFAKPFTWKEFYFLLKKYKFNAIVNYCDGAKIYISDTTLKKKNLKFQFNSIYDIELLGEILDREFRDQLYSVNIAKQTELAL